MKLHFIKIAITVPVFFAVTAETGDQKREAIPFEFKFSKARITLEGRSRVLEGRLTLTPDSLRFEPQEERPYDRPYAPPHRYEPLALSLRDVNRIETPNGSWAALGAGIGAAVGLAITVVLSDELSGTDLLGGLFLLIIPGAGIGGLVGSSQEQWQTVYDSQDSLVPTEPFPNEGRVGATEENRNK